MSRLYSSLCLSFPFGRFFDLRSRFALPLHPFPGGRGSSSPVPLRPLPQNYRSLWRNPDARDAAPLPRLRLLHVGILNCRGRIPSLPSGRRCGSEMLVLAFLFYLHPYDGSKGSEFSHPLSPFLLSLLLCHLLLRRRLLPLLKCTFTISSSR